MASNFNVSPDSLKRLSVIRFSNMADKFLKKLGTEDVKATNLRLISNYVEDVKSGKVAHPGEIRIARLTARVKIAKSRNEI